MTATMTEAPTAILDAVEETELGEQIIPMTYEEYLAWPVEGRRIEWTNGKAIIFMPSTFVHADLMLFLATLLRMFARRLELGTVLASPMEMRILDPHVAREPDVFFVAKHNIDRLHRTRLEGPADLAIEIISNDSVGRDRGDKFDEYERAGIGEYWIADPRPGRRRFDAWVLGDDEKFRAVLPDEDGRYYSTVLSGFWLKPDWLWQDPLPEETILLEEILRTVLSKV